MRRTPMLRWRAAGVKGTPTMADYVYLDSNVFWLMKPEHQMYNEEFLGTVERLRRRYKFPFSEAHFLDIAAGDLPGKEAYVERDLAFLAEISQGRAVKLCEEARRPPDQYDPAPGPVPGGGPPWIVHVRFEDIAAGYRNMPKDLPQKPSFHVAGTSHEVGLNKVAQDHPMRPLLEAAGGMLSPELIKDYLDRLWEHKDDPDIYRSFREWVGKACEQIGSPCTLLAADAGSMERAVPFKALMSAKTPEGITAALAKATDALCLMRGERLDGLSWPERLVRAYSLLDFHSDLWDKINRNNRPSNMRRDSKHLIYAAGAPHLVTEDGRFAAKAKVVFSAFGVGTKVSNMSEFKIKFN